MRRNLTTVFAMILLFSSYGCMKMMVGAMGYESTKYDPLYVYPEDYTRLVQIAKEDRDKIVRDERGEYYFSFFNNDKYLARWFVLEGQNQFVRNILKRETGVLEPVYEIDEGFKLVPNWKKTKILMEELIQNNVFNLLPIAASKKYHELFMQKMTEQYLRQVKDREVSFADLGRELNNAFGGEYSVYNSALYDNVLKYFEDQASFFISSRSSLVDLSTGLIIAKWAYEQGSESYEKEKNEYKNEPEKLKSIEDNNKQRVTRYIDSMTWSIQNYTGNISSQSSVVIGSFAQFKGMSKAGFFKKFSSMIYMEDISKRHDWFKSIREHTSLANAYARAAKANKDIEDYEKEVSDSYQNALAEIGLAEESNEKLQKYLLKFINQAKDVLKITGVQKTTTLE